MPLLIEVSPGELADRASILRLKAERIDDRAKRRCVRAALADVEPMLRALEFSPGWPAGMAAELAAVNALLWEAEDRIRALDRAGDFGAAFVAVSRSIRAGNDRRAALKRSIDAALGSPPGEVKGHEHDPAPALP